MSSVIAALLIAFVSWQAGANLHNVDKQGLALEGYDPVSYFGEGANKKGPLKGNPKSFVLHNKIKYHFSSEANKAKFLESPDKYVPAFGGWCAYAVAAKKEKVEVDPKSFVIQDQRLLLFYDGFLADTRDKWLNTKEKSSSAFFEEAKANWVEIEAKEQSK